ncbi:MAG: CoA-acylating methylmalonate-semialdehyde dehydrogenase, partial [Anaerolineae bacterium]|nr:CoA-acylating methylmalonate-semialdehyde dehydrogenase [Anaerolineae bacterium]
MSKKLMNYVNGAWIESTATEYQNVINPATGETLCQVPLSPAKDVDAVVQAASTAFDAWRRTPATTRIQYLFKLKELMEVRFEDFARTIVLENGKTIQEARGEMRRAIENVETACGIPVLMQGYLNEDIASGIDEMMIRQPLGVVAIIAPFNFPGMIPFWFLPYALATGNTVIIKPSERCPMTMHLVLEVIEQLDLPAGVVNLVNGGPEAVNTLLDHPTVKAVSFVGSTPVARHVYSRGAASGKRVQAQGGAKNPLVLMPDADVEMTTRIVTDSVFGNAGQRCLAAANIIMVGKAQDIFLPALQEAALERVVGYGLDENTQMGPVITPQSKTRIQGLIHKGVEEGAELVVDGRQATIAGYVQGNYLLPSILKNVSPKSEIARTEIFGPVMSVMHAETLGDALQIVNGGAYGNMACIFTNSGGAARRFRNEAMAGNIGVNIGVAAPMAFFPFSGWKDSFFGTLHGQGQHAVEFYTQTKVVIERWLKEWTRE